MSPIFRLAASAGIPALAMILAASAPSAAQEQPTTDGSRPSPALPAVTLPASPTSATPAPGWSGYRPGRAWGSGRGIAGRVTTSSATPPRAIITQSGWKTYAPATAWSGYGPATPSPVVSVQVPAHPGRSGWATYAPSSAWVGYRGAGGWQSYQPASTQPMRMLQARVPGPSPYADGLARNYYEYGTGRPVPLAKPWLPGSP